jgi:primase-polymerase (primpol)-like protein
MLTPPFVGIDLDSCVHPETKEPQDWARAILEQFKSYSEVSPSGRGYKILVKGRLDKGHHGTKLGVFQNGRYFCITGHAVNGSQAIGERQKERDALIKREWPEDLEPEEKPKTTSPHAEDDKLVDRMISASNGEKVIKLLNGEWQGDYSSQSEADKPLSATSFSILKTPHRLTEFSKRRGFIETNGTVQTTVAGPSKRRLQPSKRLTDSAKLPPPKRRQWRT